VKQVLFHPKARETIKSFPTAIKASLGKALYLLQIGKSLTMPTSRAMPTVGRGVSELRLQGPDGAFRIFYITKLGDSVFVFHAFKKKTQATPALELELARKRLKEIIDG